MIFSHFLLLVMASFTGVLWENTQLQPDKDSRPKQFLRALLQAAA